MTYVSNLYDTFFPTGKDHRVPKPSAAHMPYLEGARRHTTHLLPSAKFSAALTLCSCRR